MLKRPFLVFFLVISVLIASVITYIQSGHFAGIVKQFAMTHLPSDLGIDGNFSDIAIKILPPGISIRNPKISVKESGLIDLPRDSQIQAQRIDLIFLPFQMFSGRIQLHRAVIVDGTIDLKFDEHFLTRKRSGKKAELDWNELLKLRAEGLALVNTRINVSVDRPGKPVVKMALLAKGLELSRWAHSEGPGYDVTLDLADIRIQSKEPVWGLKDWNLPTSAQSLTGIAQISSNGLLLEDLKLKTDVAELQSSGVIKGDLLNPKKLWAEMHVGFQGDAGQLLSLIQTTRKKKASSPSEAKGALQAKAEFRGSILPPYDDLSVSVSIEGSQVAYAGWNADLLTAEASWARAADPAQETIQIEKVVVSSKAVAKSGGFQPGSGGRIETGRFAIPLGEESPVVTIPMNLHDAHIHWLGAGAIDSVYPMDFEATGPVELNLELDGNKLAGQPKWEALAKFNLAVKRFQLDNQAYHERRTLQRIVVAENLVLDGGVKVTPKKLVPQDLVLALPSATIKVGGEVDFQQGFDLRIGGPMKLSDVAELAGKKILGEGNLDVHVHGKGDAIAIDFDGDLNNTSYLDLDLGHMKGKISWLDGSENLVFDHVAFQKGNSDFELDGKIDFKNDSAIALGVRVDKGDVRDLIRIFDSLTENLWWFPRSLYGRTNGRFQITGAADLDRLVVNGELHGTEWDYLGEKFRKVSLKGGYDKRRYFIDSFEGRKRNGALNGKISFDQNQEIIDWNLTTRKLTLREIDQVARLDVPIRGDLHVTTRGSGKIGSVNSETKLVLDDVSVRGQAMPSSDLLVRSEKGKLEIQGNALGGQGVVDFLYDSGSRGKGHLRGKLKRLDFSPVLLLLNPKTIQDRTLVGRISGSMDFTFASDAFERASGHFEVSEYLLAKSGTRFELVKPVSTQMKRGSFDLKGVVIRGNQKDLKMNLSSDDTELSGDILGALDLSILEFFSPTIVKAQGSIAVDADIDGTLLKPEILGNGKVRNASIKLDALESPIENIEGESELRQNVLSFNDFVGDLAGGRASMDGKVTIYADRFPELDLTTTLNGNRLRVYPLQVAKVRGNLHVHGSGVPYTVDGNIVVDNALIREDVLNHGQTRTMKSARYMPSASSSRQEGDFPKFTLNIDARADDGVVVQNDLFDAELRGKVKIVNTIEAPRILGTAELIQGRMSFRDRVFQIQSAGAEFDNPTVINPKFNLTATTEVNGTKIQVFSSGRLDKFKVEFSSNPPMSEADIQNLLAMGLTSNELSNLRTGDRSAYEQGEVGAIVLHSLGFNKEVKERTGFEIQLDESVTEEQGSSIFRPKLEGESVSTPKIVIKRQVTKDVDVSVGSTVGAGGTSEREVTAEWKVNKGLSVQGIFETKEGVNTQNQQQSQQSFGVDLKVQKRFK